MLGFSVCVYRDVRVVLVAKAGGSNGEGGRGKSSSSGKGSQQLHRCRFCKQEGHNIRSCKELKKVRTTGYHRQQCSVCGGVGHNKRNCPDRLRQKCTVCNGTQRIVCLSCKGFGTTTGAERSANFGQLSSSENSGPLGKLYDSTPLSEQDVMLLRAKERVRQHMLRVHQSNIADDPLHSLVGKGGERCRACQGKGYLTCLQCNH